MLDTTSIVSLLSCETRGRVRIGRTSIFHLVETRRTKRCNSAAVATFLASVTQLQPPADRQHYHLFVLPKTRMTSFDPPTYRQEHFERSVTVVEIALDERYDCTISLACGGLHFRSHGVGPLYDLLRFMGGPDCHEPHVVPIVEGELSIVFDREYFDVLHLTLVISTSFLKLTVDTDADRRMLIDGLADALRKL
jgi:hypothetical protein